MSSTVERLSVLKPKAESLERVRYLHRSPPQSFPALHSFKVKYLFTNLAKQVIANEGGCNEYTVWVQTESPITPNIIVHER